MRQMLFRWGLSWILCGVLLLTACTVNPLAGFVNQNSDVSLYQSALTAIDSSNWTTAIADIQAMTANGQAERNTQFTLATALAGECGFQMATFVQGLLTNLPSTTTSIPLLLMQSFQNTTVNMVVAGKAAPTLATDSTYNTYCSWSQQVMDNIQTNYGPWNINEQTFVVFFSLARIGMILQYTAGGAGLPAIGGTGTANGSGNLIPSAGFDFCQKSSLNDFYATQLVTAFALLAQNGSAVTALATPLQAFSLVCQVPGQSMNFCTHTTPALVNASPTTLAAGAVNPLSSNDLTNIRSILTAQVAGTLLPVNATGQSPYFAMSALDPNTVYGTQSASDPNSGVFECEQGGTALVFGGFVANGAGDGYLKCCH